MTLLSWAQLRHMPLIKPSSAQVHAGDCIVLSGASGSGKTLLWRALAGIDPCAFDSLQCKGTSYADTAPSVWRLNVCYVAQHALFSEGSARDALEAPFAYRRHRHQLLDTQRIEGWLTQLGKSPTLLEQPVSELSGGERQIIHILRSLQFSPAVLLLDEPTAALDGDAVLAFEALIAQWLSDDAQRAVLWISHDDEQSERIATRHWLMRDHQLISDSTSS